MTKIIGCQFPNKRHFMTCEQCSLEEDPVECDSIRKTEGLVLCYSDIERE